MTYHPADVGVVSLVTDTPTLCKNMVIKFLRAPFDIIRLTVLNFSSIIESEQTFAENKGVRIMTDYKEQLIALLNKLSHSQLEYLYYLVAKLFGHTTD